jgi:hypothetical protein
MRFLRSILLVAMISLSLFLYSAHRQVYADAWLNSGATDTCGLVNFAVTENTPCNRNGANAISEYTVSVNASSRDNKPHTITYITATDACIQGLLSNNSPSGECNDNLQENNQTINVPTTVVMDRTYNQNTCGSYQEDFYVTAVDGNTNCTYGTWGTQANGFKYVPGANALCQTGTTCSGAPISQTCNTLDYGVLLYQAVPTTYSWTVQPPYYSSDVRSIDQGKTFGGNTNPWGYEMYVCDSKGGTIKTQDGKATDDFSKNIHDVCIPQASSVNGEKLWNPVTGCLAQYQEDYDGPSQTEDTRTQNGTGLPNSQLSICTTHQTQPGANPFLTIQKTITYQPSMCQGSNAIVLAGRADPQNAECSNLNIQDVIAHPQNYTASQLSCFLYIDDLANVSACKNGVCNSMNVSSGNSLYPQPQPSQSLCSLFSQGAGDYSVTVKAYDDYAAMYGSSSLWLTTRNAAVCPTNTISGTVYIDGNKNGIKDNGETNYTGPITITTSKGEVTTSGGAYTISDIPPDSQVIVSYTNLPDTYSLIYPRNGPPPSFDVTTGSTCNTNGANGANCTNGNITNLNFAVTNNNPWWQANCSDVRMDSGIVDLLPLWRLALTADSSCFNTPGIAFTGDTWGIFGQGFVSTSSQISGGTYPYPEVFAPPQSSPLASSYTSLVAKAQNAGISPVNLSSVCSLANCTLPPSLPHGVFYAGSDVKLNAFTVPANQNYVFLINGTLTIQGSISVPVGSTALFASAKDIVVASSVGSLSTDTTSDLDGWYVAGGSFILNSTNSCPDLRLNVAGSVVVNALGNGGSLQNNRDLCADDANYPTISFMQRLDLIMNAPLFIKQQQTVSQEIAP